MNYRRPDPTRDWEVYGMQCSLCGRIYIGSCDCPAQFRIAEHYWFATDVRHQLKSGSQIIFGEIAQHSATLSAFVLARLLGSLRTKSMLRATEQHFMDRYGVLDKNSDGSWIHLNRKRAFAGDPMPLVLSGLDQGSIYLVDNIAKYPLVQFIRPVYQ